MSEKDLHTMQMELLVQEAKLRAEIYRNASTLAKKKGWGEVDGIEALYLIFAEKHHWTPEQVRQLSTEELQVLLQAV